MGVSRSIAYPSNNLCYIAETHRFTPRLSADSCAKSCSTFQKLNSLSTFCPNGRSCLASARGLPVSPKHSVACQCKRYIQAWTCSVYKYLEASQTVF
jgi:hypothetical protein